MTKTPAKKYDTDFKNNVVNRYLGSGNTLKAVAEEASLTPKTLSGWVKAHQKANPSAVSPAPKKAKTAPSPASKSNTSVSTASKTSHTLSLAEKTEVEQLRKALKEAVEEREILRRALAIVSAGR